MEAISMSKRSMKKYQMRASAFHGEMVSVNVESGRWLHGDGVLQDYMEIYCSGCGRFFRAVESFNLAHSAHGDS